MKSVHFLVDRSRIVHHLMTPVRANVRRLLDRGYQVRFFHSVSDRMLSCDILGLVSKPTLKKVQEFQTVIQEDSPTVHLLQRARERAGKVVWLDSSDSTGVTHFELLQYVDLYLKKQLLRDRSRYREPVYGGRIFSDYYHREFGIEDSTDFQQYYPLPEEEESKVALSWNLGMGDLYEPWPMRSRLSRVFPKLFPPRYDPPFIDSNEERPYDLFLRASADWHRDSVAFHRKELVRRLETLIERHGLSGSASTRSEHNLPRQRYYERLKQTNIAMAPFGWGEVTMREYEALMFGALVLRPDASHMDTWPDIFQDGETCVFFRWDFSDLEAKLLFYLTHDEERRRIAAAGQERYHNLLSPAGMERFSDWFAHQLES